VGVEHPLQAGLGEIHYLNPHRLGGNPPIRTHQPMGLDALQCPGRRNAKKEIRQAVLIPANPLAGWRKVATNWTISK
jgi:hypothetical protein